MKVIKKTIKLIGYGIVSVLAFYFMTLLMCLCLGCSTATSVVRQAITPSIDRCLQYETLDEIKKDFGAPVSIHMSEQKIFYTFRKGLAEVEIVVQNDKIVDRSCIVKDSFVGPRR